MLLLRDELLSTHNPHELLYVKIPQICGTEDPKKLIKEFNKIYKKKLEEVQKENKITDLFEQVDEALKRAREYEFYLKTYD